MKKLVKFGTISSAVLIVTCIISSCVPQISKQATSPLDTEGPIIQMPETDKILFWGSVNMVMPDGITEEDCKKARMEFFKGDRLQWYANKHDHIVRSQTWQEAHMHARSIIESTKNDKIAFEIAQITASSMLRNFFFSLAPTPEVTEAIDYYMNILLSYQYYREANLFAPMLIKLKGRWSQERIREVAQKCIYENTHFFREPFSAEKQLKVLSKRQLAQNSSQEISSGTSTANQNLPNSSEESLAVERLRARFYNDVVSIIEEQKIKMKPKDKSAWVFGDSEALILLDMMTKTNK